MHILNRIAGMARTAPSLRRALMLLSGALMALAAAGCAHTLDARLLTAADYEQAIASRENAFVGTILSGHHTGRKYIENYLLGSIPERAKAYAEVHFRVDMVAKGRIDAPEVTFREMLANGQGFRFRFGDRFLAAFDGSWERPRKLTLVPVE